MILMSGTTRNRISHATPGATSHPTGNPPSRRAAAPCASATSDDGDGWVPIRPRWPISMAFCTQGSPVRRVRHTTKQDWTRMSAVRRMSSPPHALRHRSRRPAPGPMRSATRAPRNRTVACAGGGLADRRAASGERRAAIFVESPHIGAHWPFPNECAPPVTRRRRVRASNPIRSRDHPGWRHRAGYGSLLNE